MAFRTPAVQLHLKTCFLLLLGGLMEAAQEQGSMYMWIDANQARILIGFEEDILIVSEGKMAPFTHDFRKAQQRMPAIPVNIHHVNFTWQATDQWHADQSAAPPRERASTCMCQTSGSSSVHCEHACQSPRFIKQRNLHLESLSVGLAKLSTQLVYFCLHQTLASFYTPKSREQKKERGEKRAVSFAFISFWDSLCLASPSRLSSQVCNSQKAEYFYEFQTLRSLDKDIMDDPTVNVPLLGSVPHKASVVQVGFPCRGDQDGVAAFEVTILVMDAGGNIILRTPHNAIFFKTCQRAKCPGGCRNGGYCNERQVCECQDGFYGIHCEKALCSPRCLNGGLCMSPGVCICPPGYFGPSCERANCSTTCLNGGTCFHPGKCICAVGFEGSRCELIIGSLPQIALRAVLQVNFLSEVCSHISVKWAGTYMGKHRIIVFPVKTGCDINARSPVEVMLCKDVPRLCLVSWVNVDSRAEMEANARGGTNASAAKATMAICAPKLSASPAVEHTGPVWSPTGASAGTAGMDVTAIRQPIFLHTSNCSLPPGFRGGVSSSQRVSGSKLKSQPVTAKDTKEVPESSQPSETNYVV
ncbi:Wnt inhibitory factor 1 [Labeo rohita]|uniref:Wnt inhibitory factor 1 n=1 Tax=Labeo rohita TaxID=84645 RepID=A0ABQ8MRI8_LABRO|nr:Wnt inhibitory factor 1 [Labeo rohita]